MAQKSWCRSARRKSVCRPGEGSGRHPPWCRFALSCPRPSAPSGSSSGASLIAPADRPISKPDHSQPFVRRAAGRRLWRDALRPDTFRRRQRAGLVTRRAAAKRRTPQALTRPSTGAVVPYETKSAREGRPHGLLSSFLRTSGGRKTVLRPSCSNVLKIQGKIRFWIQWLARLKITCGAGKITCGAGKITFGANFHLRKITCS